MAHRLEEISLPAPLDELNPRDFIIIKGAKVHNLKGLSVALPRNKLIVITGLSGSGKSSLAFDTLFAEGQRMYVETLSSYARQFVGRMEKPDVEYIRGVAPAIAIEQRVSTRNPRSTVGTSTEIYDYLKLFYARIGKTYSPVSGAEVRREGVEDVLKHLQSLENGTRVLLLCPLKVRSDRTLRTELQVLLSKGFPRLFYQDSVVFTEDFLASLPEDSEPAKGKKSKAKTLAPSPVSAEGIFILIDRVVISHTEEEQFRLADSVQTAFFEGEGILEIRYDPLIRIFSDRFEADGIRFEEPSVNLFSFNNSYGACKTCEGFGNVLGIDEALVFPDHNLSVFEGAIAAWNSENMRAEWLQPLLRNGILFDFPIHRPYYQLSEEQRTLIWTGNAYFRGLNDYFKYLESNTYKIQHRVQLSRFRGKTTCPDCQGSRLRKDAGYVKIGGKSIIDLVLMPVEDLLKWFEVLPLNAHEKEVSRHIFREIRNRLLYLREVGLGYLTLNRLSSSLSGGEFQRIKLATSLGSALVGSMYILDEPSIGLHPRDTRRLVSVLKTLRDLGNTVIVVEHEEEVMLAADQLIDIGPGAGTHGGELVFQGKVVFDNAAKPMGTLENRSRTFRYLNGLDEIAIPVQRRSWRDFVRILGARENNLANLDVQIPMHVLTVVTGVSGSGKSTLINKVLYPALAKMLGVSAGESGKFLRLEGSYQKIRQVEYVDQNPIGKSSRSNPVSYIKAYDHIRTLFSELPLSIQKGFKPGHFSFNVEGGRCEMCQGEGINRIEMQFMADILLPCESCGGKRFMEEILEVEYKGKNVADVLSMTVDDAILFFEEKQRIADKIKVLQEVGLGYVQLGQSSNTLSGGEAQRVKLAYYLSLGKAETQSMFFIFDEPTTGLHFHDIGQLLSAINRLVDRGNSVVVIEHNLEVIKSADWIIDLGPEGGDKGGQLVFEGTPEEMLVSGIGHTADALKQKMLR
jgi:excinuclease ABC subunit A